MALRPLPPELGSYRGFRPACTGVLAAVSPRPPTWRSRLRALRSAWLQVIGAPDYAAYVGHLRRHHPLTPPLSEREYVRAFFDRRYRERLRCC